MSAATLFAQPFAYITNPDGTPAVGAKIRAYITGTSTPTPLYTNAGLSIAWTQPIETDAEGKSEGPIYVPASPTLKVDVVYSDDTPCDGFPLDPWTPYALSDGGGGSSEDGRLIGIQTITTTGAGTYTPTSGTGFIVLELQGGGGGGGAADTTSGGAETNVGQGGGGGCWGRVKITSSFSGAAYVVGAKGAAGTAGGNGGNGVATTWGGGVYSAGGGTGGTGQNAGAVVSVRAGGAGGTATGAFDISFPGQAGSIAVAASITSAIGGNGGASYYSRGGVGGASLAGNTATAGGAAGGKGGGGGGSSATPNATGVDGGAGSDGCIVIYEYS